MCLQGNTSKGCRIKQFTDCCFLQIPRGIAILNIMVMTLEKALSFYLSSNYLIKSFLILHLETRNNSKYLMADTEVPIVEVSQSTINGGDSILYLALHSIVSQQHLLRFSEEQQHGRDGFSSHIQKQQRLQTSGKHECNK